LTNLAEFAGLLPTDPPIVNCQFKLFEQ